MRYLLPLFFLSSVAAQNDWPAYGNSPGGTRYSPLRQIGKANVAKLTQVWEFHTGEAPTKKSAFEATPIFVDGVLYLSTPFNQVIALDAESGKQKWRFDPGLPRDADYSEFTSRGVSYWRNPRGGGRIFFGTLDARLLCLDAATGKPCTGFAAVDLKQGVAVRDAQDYQVTSPPAIAGNVVITGSSIGDNRAANVERGIVRGFDARSGKQLWQWDPIAWAEKGEPRTGAANAWGVLSVDPANDLVFIPTGSAAPDFYGGLRPGNNAAANSVTALRASTGKQVWTFQVVHHDLWDYDVASQPVLFQFKGEPAVAITTKMGNVFVLNRLTGKPLAPVEERPVPASDVKGEKASPTQPFSAIEPLVPQSLRAEDAWGPDEASRVACAAEIAKLRSEGMFTPPSLQGTVVFPGNVGGVNWGGAAIDESRGMLIANTNRLATIVRLIPRADVKQQLSKGENNRLGGEYGAQLLTPYGMYRHVLLSPAPAPCNKPPWGTITALDLNSGKKKWETPIGSMVVGGRTLPEELGSINLGGPIVTAGGIAFTAASTDTTFRAFDAETGAVLWRHELPASAQATPMTFSWKGRQYVVLCAGGHGKLSTKQGDSVVAFALPQ